MDSDHLYSQQWKHYVRIRFGFLQRLKVLFGWRAFVFFQGGTPPAHYEFLAPASYDPNDDPRSFY